MSDTAKPGILRFDVRLKARPETIWRAMAEDDYRRTWLPDQRVLDVLRSEKPDRLTLLVEECDPPYAQGVVSFELHPAADGGTWLRLIHHQLPARVLPAPANDGGAPRMCLAA